MVDERDRFHQILIFHIFLRHNGVHGVSMIHWQKSIRTPSVPSHSGPCRRGDTAAAPGVPGRVEASPRTCASRAASTSRVCRGSPCATCTPARARPAPTQMPALLSAKAHRAPESTTTAPAGESLCRVHTFRSPIGVADGANSVWGDCGPPPLELGPEATPWTVVLQNREKKGRGRNSR